MDGEVVLKLLCPLCQGYALLLVSFLHFLLCLLSSSFLLICDSLPLFFSFRDVPAGKKSWPISGAKKAYTLRGESG